MQISETILRQAIGAVTTRLAIVTPETVMTAEQCNDVAENCQAAIARGEVTVANVANLIEAKAHAAIAARSRPTEQELMTILDEPRVVAEPAGAEVRADDPPITPMSRRRGRPPKQEKRVGTIRR